MTTSTQCRRVSFLDIFESLLKLRELTLRNIVRKRIRRALSNTRFRSQTFRRSDRSRYSQIELAISGGVSCSICVTSSWQFVLTIGRVKLKDSWKVNKLELWGQNWSGIHIQTLGKKCSLAKNEGWEPRRVPARIVNHSRALHFEITSSNYSTKAQANASSTNGIISSKSSNPWEI